MTVRTLLDAMDTIAPWHLAESWDNVGLIVGDEGRELDGPVLLSIDTTPGVVEEAIGRRASALISYHPPIWNPIRRLVASGPKQACLVRALEARLAICSPHTALDAAAGGLTDWLADGVLGTEGAGDRRAIQPFGSLASSQQLKLVVFVPDEHVDRVREAVASAGAGRIGEYRLCSFTSPGQGTFFGSEGTDPAVGKSGRLERVEERRLEMVCSRSSLPLVVEMLRQFHPYEEPAFDVYELTAKPSRGVGAGRRITLDHPTPIETIAERLRGHLAVRAVKVARPAGHDGMAHRIGVVPGAGAELAETAREDDCDLFVTGEMRYHEVAAALDKGLAVMLGGHANTERGYMPILATRLQAALEGVEVRVAESDQSFIDIV